MDGKAEALFHDSIVKGATLAEGLQKALDEALAKLPIPKVMTYQLADGWSSVNFVRPAHGLVALHGGEVVPVEALGLKAGRSTHGHRFEAAVDPVRAARRRQLREQLENDGAVIASFEARRAEIVRQLADAAAKVGSGPRRSKTKPCSTKSPRWSSVPTCWSASSRSEFLEVPQECLILTMKANQKYFPLLDAAGKLTNKFLVVSNIRPDDAERGDRRQRARGAPAPGRCQVLLRPGPQEDAGLARRAGLAKVVYHNKLGTQGERVERVRARSARSARQLGGDALAQQADQAALLAKADLLTDMVGEFPELQGIMGRYYALHDGLGDDSRRRDRRPLQAALRRRRAAAQPGGRRGRAGRQAGNPGRPVRHRPAAHRRQGSVRAAPPRAGRRPHADREGPAAGTGRDRWTRPWRLFAAGRRQDRRLAVGLHLRAARRHRCASRATARRKSTPCWRCGRSGWAMSPSGWRLCAPLRRCPRRRAGRGQQAHRQHPQEGARRPTLM